MQNDNKEILTSDEIMFLNHLSIEKKIDALHYLANEALGLMLVSEYQKVTNMRPRTIYDHIKKGKLKSNIFLNQTVIIMND
jgi:hypothetical protein